MTTVTKQLNWLRAINILYGVVGVLLLGQYGGAGAWKSFVAGWALAVVNLELLRRLGLFLLAIYEGRKLDPMFYLYAVGKFAFWALVIALFSTASWIQGIPFAIGGLTLVIAGVGLAVVVGPKDLEQTKELTNYAR